MSTNTGSGVSGMLASLGASAKNLTRKLSNAVTSPVAMGSPKPMPNSMASPNTVTNGPGINASTRGGRRNRKNRKSRSRKNRCWSRKNRK